MIARLIPALVLAVALVGAEPDITTHRLEDGAMVDIRRPPVGQVLKPVVVIALVDHAADLPAILAPLMDDGATALVAVSGIGVRAVASRVAVELHGVLDAVGLHPWVRVFVGHGVDAGTATRLAAARPERSAGVVCSGGGSWLDVVTGRHLHHAFLHGAKDPASPIGLIQTAADQARDAGVPVRTFFDHRRAGGLPPPADLRLATRWILRSGRLRHPEVPPRELIEHRKILDRDIQAVLAAPVDGSRRDALRELMHLPLERFAVFDRLQKAWFETESAVADAGHNHFSSLENLRWLADGELAWRVTPAQRKIVAYLLERLAQHPQLPKYQRLQRHRAELIAAEIAAGRDPAALALVLEQWAALTGHHRVRHPAVIAARAETDRLAAWLGVTPPATSAASR